jgi:hypothetical protein
MPTSYCDVKCCEYAEAIIESEALAVDLEAHLREAPDPKRSTGSFEPAEGVKEVCRIRATTMGIMATILPKPFSTQI